jgi:GntR family transcriptional regulator
MLTPEIDPRGELPPYQQIAAWLRTRIESGDLAAGGVLPSEKELMGTFEVGRSTVRRAIAMLRTEDLVRTVPQRGSYVTRR